MNWELIHRLRRARRARFPHLLEQTSRIQHCITVAGRLQELSASVAAVAGETGEWDAVVTALGAVITDAAVALDALTEDAAFELDRQMQRAAKLCAAPGPAVLTLQAAAALSPALLQRPRRAA